MVVVEVVHSGGDAQRGSHARKRYKPWVAGDRSEPCVHRHRRGNVTAESAPINDRNHRRQHQKFCSRTQQDAAAGDHSQFCYSDKARQ